MMEERLKYLFERHLAGACTVAEKEELAALSLEPGNETIVKELVNQSWQITGTEEDMPGYKAQQLLDVILREERPEYKGKVRRMNWQQLVAAASVLLLVGLGSYWLFFTKEKKQPEAVQPGLAKDVEAPTGTKAMIILADGRKVELDSVASGILAMQGNVKVERQANGDIIYSHDLRTGKEEIVYNTLFNPRGSKVATLTLADGTKVWLNSESSLKYFTAVGSSERKVEITGEAYFEVAHDATRPFYVKKADVEVQVLGTHFNVNAYDDEDALKVTLLEGSVKVALSRQGGNQGDREIVIKPGEQAIRTTNPSERLIRAGKVNVEQVMAWKNGLFSFQHADIQTVMRQLSRWYDVSVSYPEKIPELQFNGEIGRNLTLREVLEGLAFTNVRFSIEGKQLIVLP